MDYIECPSVYHESLAKSLFLAGGISHCSNWQEELISLLKEEDITLINPRRKSFDLNNKDLEEEQITWEFNHLKKADALSFWFTKETVCPITLYELGKACMTQKKIFIGVHPQYARKSDVEIQTKLIRPEITLVYSLQELSLQIKDWINHDKP